MTKSEYKTRLVNLLLSALDLTTKAQVLEIEIEEKFGTGEGVTDNTDIKERLHDLTGLIYDE